MAVELKEVIQKAKTKKEVHNSQGSKKNKEEKLMVDKECEQLKKEAVKALREWKRTKINRNSLLEAKRR
jgi:hypothetical protein